MDLHLSENAEVESGLMGGGSANASTLAASSQCIGPSETPATAGSPIVPQLPGNGGVVVYSMTSHPGSDT